MKQSNEAMTALRETLDARLMNVEDAGDVFLDLSATGEFWVAVFDLTGVLIVLEMVIKHYSLDKAGAEDCICLLMPGADFGAIALRRRLMLAPKLRWLLSKFDVNITERELLENKVLTLTAPGQMSAAEDFIKSIVGDKCKVLFTPNVASEKQFIGGQRQNG